jgi:leucyl-tRNA synthetase
MGDYGSATPWNDSSVKGCKRFIDRVVGLADMAKGAGVTPKLESAFHKTIKKVSQDIEEMKFNTAIAAMMSFMNEIYEVGSIDKDSLKTLTKLLSPFAPHICEEMWASLGEKGFCSTAKWPEYDEALTVDDEKEIAVQVCGKLKGVIVIPAGAEEDAVWEIIQANEGIMQSLEGKQIIKKIYIKDKIFNIVAK